MIGERLLLLMGIGPIRPAWRERSLALASERNLTVLVDRPDMLCATDHRSVQMTHEPAAAIILGDIFHRSSFGPSRAPLSEKDLAQCARTRGASLIERTWGSYIALFCGETAEVTSVIRSPFGRLPLYFTRCGQCLVAASSVDLLLSASGLRPSINWLSVQQHLQANQLRQAATCLSDVEELLPGFRLSAETAAAQMIWNPADYCSLREDMPIADVSRKLREVTDLCVRAWSQTYDRAVLGVSGGLDSSVVAASAISAGARVSCLTLVTSDPAGDERIFARDLTDFLGTELFEFKEDPREIDLRTSAAAHLPRPVARSFAQSGNRRNLELAQQADAKAFFSGGGGDNVFCYLQTVSILVDALRDLGPGRRAWQVARDLASLSGASFWEVFRRTVARRLAPKPWPSWPLDRSFLNNSCIWPAKIEHPWLTAAAELSPGKRAHVTSLMNVQNHLDGFGREKVLPIISPLLSQPLVEFCLGVPSWVWLEGGANRAPVRRAYSDALPPSVLMRRSKGTPDPFLIEIYETHRELVRELLLEGLLAQQGLLDIAAIDAATSSPGPVRGQGYYRLLALVDVEAWLRSWQGRS